MQRLVSFCSSLALLFSLAACADKPAAADGEKASTSAASKATAGEHAKEAAGAHENHAAHGGAAVALASAAASGGADGKARVFFVFPHDNSKVYSPVPLVFGVEGMTVTPAGQAMEDKTKGHHHIIVDGEPVALGAAVPADDRHIHFGKGQTETRLPLSPGKHTLTLQFADGAHLSYGPSMSQTITVEVVESKEPPKVSFALPANGAKVKSPVQLKFALAGMAVRPAGEDPLDKTSGHHHVIVDGEAVPLGVAVPADDKHIHYGKGQLEAELPLAPGKHTLTLQLADGAHISYGPELSQTITVEVEP